MTVKLRDPFKQVFWPSFTDLIIGVFSLLVFTLIVSIIQQTSQARQIEIQEEKIADISRQNKRLEEDLRDAVNAGLISVKDGHIDIMANILFPSGSSQLNPEGKTLLKNLVEPLRKFISGSNDVLMISGFTDDVVINNRRFPSNWELSTSRATEVVKQLIADGFRPEKIFAAGFGEFHPIISNAGEKTRRRNRRVEITRLTLEFAPRSLTPVKDR